MSGAPIHPQRKYQDVFETPVKFRVVKFREVSQEIDLHPLSCSADIEKEQNLPDVRLTVLTDYYHPQSRYTAGTIQLTIACFFFFRKIAPYQHTTG